MARPAYLISKNCKWFSLSLLAVLGLFPFLATPQDSASSSEAIAKTWEDPDAYSIYAILLESEKHTFFVIQSETESFHRQRLETLE
jgi:hypothetical protein